MTIQVKDELIEALKTAGLEKNVSLLAMHLSEIEGEAGVVLDLLTELRSHTYRGDIKATQETLAELSIALEHLNHHTKEVLPGIETHLEIEPK